MAEPYKIDPAELDPIETPAKPYKVDPAALDPTGPMAAATAMPRTTSAAASPAFRGTSADPTPAAPNKEGWGSWAGRQAVGAGTFAAGEAGGPALLRAGIGAIKGAEEGSELGPWGMAGGAAIGAGMTTTAFEVLKSYYEQWKNGTPMPLDHATVLKMFGVNTLTSLVGSGMASGRFSEAPAIVGKTEEAETAHVALGQGIKDQRADLVKKVEDIRQSKLGEVSDAARTEGVQQLTGVTPKAARAAKFPPTEATDEVNWPSAETLEHSNEVKGAYFDAKHAIGKKLGGDIGAFRNKVKNQPIIGGGDDPTGFADLQSTIVKQTQYKEDYLHSYSPAVAKLYAQAKKISGLTLSDEEQKTLFGTSKKTFVDQPGKLGQRSEAVEMEEGQGEDDIVPKAKAPSTLGNIVALKAKAARLAAVSHDDVSAHAANEIDEAAERMLDRSVPASEKKAWEGMRARYANYKNYFRREDGRAMRTTRTAPEAADRIFNNQELAKAVIDNSSPGGLKSLREGFGLWAHNNPDKVLASSAKDAADKALVYGKLFPGNRLASDPKSLLYVGATIDNIEKSPIQKANFERAFQQSQRKLFQEAAPKTMKLGLDFADEIGGPMGESYRKQIETAYRSGGPDRGPQMAAEKSMELYTGFSKQGGGFDREAFIKDLASKQPQFGASISKKATGKIYIQRMTQDPDLVAPIGGIAAAHMAVMGNPGFYGMLAPMAATLSARRFITNLFVRSLDDPVKITAVLNGTKAARIGVMNPLADLAVKASYDEVASEIVKKLAGVTLEPEPKEKDGEAGGVEAAR